MLVRVTLTGSGTDADPWRVPLPTFNLRDISIVGGFAIVEVPDADVLSLGVTLPFDTIQIVKGQPVVTTLTPQQLDDWYAQLQKRYGVTASKFRPTTK